MKKRIDVQQEAMRRLKKLGYRNWIIDMLGGVPEGMRHYCAIRLVGHWYGKGLYAEEVVLLLLMWNKLNRPPLGRQELKSIFQSTRKWEYPR